MFHELFPCTYSCAYSSSCTNSIVHSNVFLFWQTCSTHVHVYFHHCLHVFTACMFMYSLHVFSACKYQHMCIVYDNGSMFHELCPCKYSCPYSWSCAQNIDTLLLIVHLLVDILLLLVPCLHTMLGSNGLSIYMITYNVPCLHIILGSNVLSMYLHFDFVLHDIMLGVRKKTQIKVRENMLQTHTFLYKWQYIKLLCSIYTLLFRTSVLFHTLYFVVILLMVSARTVNNIGQKRRITLRLPNAVFLQKISQLLQHCNALLWIFDDICNCASCFMLCEAVTFRECP